MTAEPSPSAGLEAAFLEHREKLLRFLCARGAGEAAEDVCQEIWLKIRASRPGPVASPLSYLYRTADLLLIDRFRSARQAGARDRAWTQANTGDPPATSAEPSAERRLSATQEAAEVMALIERLGTRPATVFRRHRIDGIAQKAIAAEMGVSLSTVESDLRVVYKALSEWKERSA